MKKSLSAIRDKLRQYDQKGKTLVYAYLRRSDGTPYYIGVSTGIGRACDQRGHRKHGISIPTDPKYVECLKHGLTKEEAAEWEQYFIRLYGRQDTGTGILRNRSAGGEGLQEPSVETRQKIGDATRGKKLDPDHLAAFHANIRDPKSEAHKAAISDAQPSKGRGHKAEHVEELRRAAARRVAANAAQNGFDIIEAYQEQLHSKRLARERERKATIRRRANSMCMSKRSYERWVNDGCPSDTSAYIKNAPRIPIPDVITSHTARRRYERNFYGLSEAAYREWVSEGRPTDLTPYKHDGSTTANIRIGNRIVDIFPMTPYGLSKWRDYLKSFGSPEKIAAHLGFTPQAMQRHSKKLEEIMDHPRRTE